MLQKRKRDGLKIKSSRGRKFLPPLVLFHLLTSLLHPPASYLVFPGISLLISVLTTLLSLSLSLFLPSPLLLLLSLPLNLFSLAPIGLASPLLSSLASLVWNLSPLYLFRLPSLSLLPS